MLDVHGRRKFYNCRHAHVEPVAKTENSGRLKSYTVEIVRETLEYHK